MIQHHHNVMHESEPSLSSLFRDLTEETRTLFKKELELAKVEMSEKASRVGRNVAYIAVGGVVVLLAAQVLLFAAVVGLYNLLAMGMERATAGWLSPLIIAVVVGAVGYGLIQKAVTTLRQTSLKPRQTIASIRELGKMNFKHDESSLGAYRPIHSERRIAASEHSYAGGCP